MQRFVLIMASLASLWFFGFLVFVYAIPKKPVDISTRSDAIVVWTGGPCRITTGVELLEQGLSNKLFVSGVETPKPQLLGRRCQSYLSAGDVDKLRDKITFGYAALSTMGNAIETAAWAKKHEVQSVRLVTTPMHMPRALIEFHMYMPDMRVISHPVSVKKFDHRNWYTGWPVFSKVALEYSKYLLIKTGIRPWWRGNIIEKRTAEG